jgi:protein TonB
MAANVLENLARWNLQIALLAVVAAGLVPLLRIHAPLIRHTFWRSVVAACLLLPLVQPWRSTVVDSSMLRIEALDTATATDLVVDVSSAGQPSLLVRSSRHVREHWTSYASAVLAFGVALRLAWLVIGIYRLQRLRRTGELALPVGGYQELAALIEAGVEIRRVDRLGQPVTFGVLRPAVLLPASFLQLPAGVQRAVLAHELWHVRRRDWAWVLFEEAIRAAFWFNPAMWWLISRVQSSREEVVDELTVQVTNARKTYLEALLVFADQPTLFPATPFARRRHLFQRMLLISREAVMSSRRIVASSVAMASVLLVTGLYASSAFPLKGTPVSPAEPAGQSPPRDRRPGEAGPATTRERELKQLIESGSAKPEQYFELARLQETRGATAEAETTLVAATRTPVSRYAQTMLAAFYNRTGRFDKTIATLETLAAAEPSTPQIYQILATFYWEKASKDPSLSDAQKRAYIDSGIEASDRALAVQDNYVDAIVYKSILVRHKANLETDPTSRQTLLAQADALRNRAMELQKARGGPTMAFAPSLEQGTLPPPPPPPPPGSEGMAPVRVGGNIKPPVKVRDVRPVYPADAQEAKVQGVVIIEATIDTVGNISSAHVLRSIPMLDQAALDAVRQWQFEPTLLNGAAVPVIMTVTVNFTLDRGPASSSATELAPPPPPPPAPAELVNGQEPVRVGGNVKPPRKVRDVRPNYPPDALAGRVQGVVILQATIDQFGNVASASVLHGPPMLTEAAVEAVNQWQFEPTQLNGVVVPVIMTVTVNFTMDK